MPNKKIPWYQPLVDVEEKKLVIEALSSNYLNDGNITDQFEEAWAKMVGAKHALAVTSGTMGMFLALKGLGVGPDDEVLVPDITFIATAHAAELTGARVILVDIDPLTLTIDIEAAERAITPRTKAIMPVHVSGRGADMAKILDLAKRHNLYVVEDAAEAFMSRQQGKYLGVIGDAGCYSLSPFKIITTGQGGIITTNNDDFYLKLVKLKDHGRPIQGSGGDDIHQGIGYNFKYTNLQAAVGLGQLKKIAFRMERIKRTLNLYRQNLLPGTVNLFPFNDAQGELPLWVDGWTERRDELETYLRNQNIDCRKFWRPLHTQIAFKQSDKFFPNSTKMSPLSIWLPSAFTLTDEDILTVCKEINNFFE